jgi:hypothetical protein
MAELRLDEKTRKSLLGLMPFTQGGVMDYTPEAYLSIPENIRPVFSLRAFTRQESCDIRSMFLNDKYSIEERAEKNMENARKVVMGWKNIYDLSTGEPLEYKGSALGADKDLFSIFPDVIVSSIFRQASVMSGLLQQEKQGLKSLPESTPEQ